MTRRGTALVAILLSLLCVRHSTFAQQSRPNILCIAVDDLRPEFGAYGAASVQFPNLEWLAKRGVTFNRSYVQQAVCSPSRSSVMTGTRPDPLLARTQRPQ